MIEKLNRGGGLFRGRLRLLVSLEIDISQKKYKEKGKNKKGGERIRRRGAR